MNKQQLASKIWASANKMRSKIEANEYKDYILGFIFYKFLSDNEVRHLKEKACWTEDELRTDLRAEDQEVVRYCQDNLGYFIAYGDLFSAWLDLGVDFSVSNVTDALNSFAINISTEANKHRVFKNIFKTLSDGITKLGGTPADRTKAIVKLIRLIKDIPTDGSEDYDVLGFIYEYLIENFAANAGKKAGEFYTPHEVSLLMAEIVANHLKDRNHIDIYDPTSGSGSLLINIGRAVAKYLPDRSQVKYYAQELKENTFNLTRMNLVMRGIDADNIMVRCGDTLEDDWPFFQENEEGKIIEGTYEKKTVDAVVSNPPYSQSWDPKGKKEDPRFKGYGLAPRGKADYAFLLHDLCHINNDGIVTIVLPHGVLFRPGDDFNIRKNLIDNNNIDTIIGLPADIFYGTGIATLIMVLKRHRPTTDVLIVDASKLSVKDGKKNRLTASDIRRIADTVINRTETPKFSCRVSRETIRENGYNLNIPRYVDSSEPLETWDAYATMFGGIPNHEIDLLSTYWQTFPSLRKDLFTPKEDTPCSELSDGNIDEIIHSNDNVVLWKNGVASALETLPGFLRDRLINNMLSLNVHREESILAENIYKRLKGLPLIDRYNAYQLLDNQWVQIYADLEMLQTEGFESAKIVDPNMVVQKAKNDNEEDKEIQKGWKGHIIPFDLIQRTILHEESQALLIKQAELSAAEAYFDELIQELPEEDKEAFLNDDNSEFDMKQVAQGLEEAFLGIETEELNTLNEYLELLEQKVKKPIKQQFIATHNNVVDWSAIIPANDGTFSKKSVEKRISELRFAFDFHEGSTEGVLVEATRNSEKVKALKKETSDLERALQELTKSTIEHLTDEQVQSLLFEKWIQPIYNNLLSIPNTIIDDLTSKITALKSKYEIGLVNVEDTVVEASRNLSKMLDELEGADFELKAISNFRMSLDSGMDGLMEIASNIKMFPCNGENTPQIRFKGYKGEWEVHPLSDYLKVSSDKNETDIFTKNDIFSVSNEYGVVNQIQYQGKSLAGASLKGYKITHKDSVIYTKSPLKNQPYGIIKTNKERSGIVSSLYAVYSVNEKAYPDFIQVYFSSDKRLNDYLRPIVNKGAKNTLLVSDEGALCGEVLFPTDIEEQKQIALFFTCLETLITAHDMKMAKLQSMKKALLDSTFVSCQ